MTLTEWLRVQLDADEQIALAATPGPWRWSLAPSMKADSALYGTHPVDLRGNLVMMTTKGHDIITHDADFIATWHPARVLAEVKAKRAILDGYEASYRQSDDYPGWEGAVHAIAQPYAGREGWQDEWATPNT